MVASMRVFNAFWNSFQPSWADLEQTALAYTLLNIGIELSIISGLRISMHANSKPFIHTLPTDMFFDLE